jgi:hypothetical protein
MILSGFFWGIGAFTVSAQHCLRLLPLERGPYIVEEKYTFCRICFSIF